MKAILFVICLLATNFYSHAQIKTQRWQKPIKEISLTELELKTAISKYDFSRLFIYTDNSVVYGFIGVNYQRIHIKFLSINKNPDSPGVYNVYGKSMVKNNIDEFHGTIKITNIHVLKKLEHGCEDLYKYRNFKGQYSLFGKYSFSENQNKNLSGIFKGIFRTDYFLDENNNIKYDDIENCADGYTNNQFVGKWTSYSGKVTKTCNWGDYRIPNSGNLDIGAGEFSPDDKYLPYGWQSLRNLTLNQKDKKAELIEEAKWWE